MKKRIVIFILCFGILLSCTGCGSTVEMTNSIKAKPLEPEQLTDEGVEAVADFSIRLLQQCYSDNNNTLLSPVCVLSALAMTANGAAGETLSQMEQVMGMSLDQLNSTVGSWQRQHSGSKDVLKTAASIWFKDSQNFTINDEFLKTDVEQFDSVIYKAAFDENTLRDINRWVSKKTDGMVENILDRIPDAAVMYLVSALAFDAQWIEKYNENAVHRTNFTCYNEETVEVEMMYSDETTYIEDQNARGFIKKYKDCDYGFAVLLPDEDTDIGQYVRSLTGQRLISVLKGASYALVETGIPKFEAEYSTEMSDVLISMGVTDAFDYSVADFSTMGTTNDETRLCISRVLHKTRISLAEDGTKAGAAAVVEMAAEGAMAYDEYYKVVLDRPFVYMIIELDTCLPIFVGTFMAP